MRAQPRNGAAIVTDTRDSSLPGKILEVTAYPPPRSGWAVRVEYVKKQLERAGHACVVINIGASRAIPSTEYETVLGAGDFIRKVWRYCRQGYVVHAHANGDAIKAVEFWLDGKKIAVRRAPPFSLDVDFGTVPQMRRIRAVALDAEAFKQ